MKRLLILGVFVLVAVGQDVQHAPTVAQCQADQRMWVSELEEDNSSSKLPSVHVLMGWTREMRDCERVDPENKVRYYNTIWEIDGELVVRLSDFIVRHDLMTQFRDEDDAGKR